MATMILEESPSLVAALPFEKSAGIYTIHATRNDQTIVTHRIIPDVAVAQARMLAMAGWRVRISNKGGRQFAPPEFDQMLLMDRVLIAPLA